MKKLTQEYRIPCDFGLDTPSWSFGNPAIHQCYDQAAQVHFVVYDLAVLFANAIADEIKPYDASSLVTHA